MADKSKELFTIVLPGGRVARVPYGVLERYVEEGARSQHGSDAAPGGPDERTHEPDPAGGSMITINVYADSGKVAIHRKQPEEDDVVAHSMSVDPATGTSEWHTDWEQGQCEYTDESGFPRTAYAWHRHPFGTEYTELFEG